MFSQAIMGAIKIQFPFGNKIKIQKISFAIAKTQSISASKEFRKYFELSFVKCDWLCKNKHKKTKVTLLIAHMTYFHGGFRSPKAARTLRNSYKYKKHLIRLNIKFYGCYKLKKYFFL